MKTETKMKIPKTTTMNSNSNNNNNPNSSSFLVQNSHLILPWLTHQQLANLSLTCKSLHNLTKTITLIHISDASRTFENFPIPFHNPNSLHPYSYFLYTPSLILSNNLPRYQPWGWKGNSVISPIPPKPVDELESVSFVDVVGCECGEVCDDDDGCFCFDGGDGDVGRECGVGCSCRRECGNRVSQNGVRVRVKIVKCDGKGWGLFADQVIAKGEFLFQYAGW
jgi:histone-lysine N-methyltransferase SETMAR